MLTILLATRNAHKIEEIKAILGQAFAYLSLQNFPNAPEVVEDAASFAGNATKKAVALARWISEPNNSQKPTNLPKDFYVLADDSGLEVDALHGAPGVHSARFAALDTGEPGNSSDAQNRDKLLRLLRDVPAEKRTARFRCLIAFTPASVPEKQSSSPVCYVDEFEVATQLFEGTCEGYICFEPRGQGGFGYDPLFVPEGYEQTFAELGEEVKNGMSHRSRALAKLKQRFVIV